MPALRVLFSISAALSCTLLLVPKAAAESAIKPRVIVITDISNEPDDEESLVRFLVYSNEFDVEGLIASTSTWLKKGPREDIIRRQVAAYGQVRDNLLKHAAGYPSADDLLAVTCTGQTGFGMASVGDGKTTAGSKRLIEAMDHADDRPLWITIWGGSNTLAQALTDLRASRSADDLKPILSKLRIYSISDQDDAGPWIRREFPGIFYIVTPSNPDNHDYFRATWTGISGDRQYKNGPRHHFELVDNPWLEEHIINNHGPLGALYPKEKYIMEGDTPSFLGLIDNGLGWQESPSYGGWGGRYGLYRPLSETHPIWTNNDTSRDTVTADNGQTETTDPATIWRWREHFQYDFAARMNWCVADAFEKANHNPVVVLNDDHTTKVVTISAKPETSVMLSAEGTTDPDKNAVKLTWWIYPEAGTLRGTATLSTTEGPHTELKIPAVKKGGTVHVILQAEDDGNPHLFAYRRAVVEVTP